MIPKVIHYVWFGGKPLTPLAERCIASWREFCPDYEIVRWDETNFDGDGNCYFEEALAAKKWAFASDYARLKVLVEHGGIYMDTDVEVLRPLDRFLIEEAFSGFESQTRIQTGLMACRDSFPLFGRLLRDYNTRRFVREDGSFDTTTNVTYITEACLAEGLVLNGEKQTVAGFTLYPRDWFCPKDHDTGELHMTEKTHTIHHFDGSWLPRGLSLYQKEKVLVYARHPNLPDGVAKGIALAGACAKDRSLEPLRDWKARHR